MDPDACLTEIRDGITEMRELVTAGETDQACDIAVTTCDHAADLDEWLSKGGFLPAEWRASQRKNLLWHVVAHVTFVHDGWNRQIQLPTFLLHASIQGITGEAHAKKVAEEMLMNMLTMGDTRSAQNAEIHITVAPVELYG